MGPKFDEVHEENLEKLNFHVRSEEKQMEEHSHFNFNINLLCSQLEYLGLVYGKHGVFGDLVATINDLSVPN